MLSIKTAVMTRSLSTCVFTEGLMAVYLKAVQALNQSGADVARKTVWPEPTLHHQTQAITFL
jgi:hypothetical protein